MHKRFVILFFAFVTIALLGCKDTPTDNNTNKPVYFLVSEINPTHHDSYILPLTKPDDIKHARDIIANPNLTTSKIVVAKIAKGSGSYINKDLIGGKTWSWHVTEFVGFADNTAEILDGNPTYVENNLDEWIRITSGTIGFWTYTVSQEVSLTN